jgi:tetratricopeptide (TPR) repeat protein
LAAEKSFNALLDSPDRFIQPDRVYSYLGYLNYKTENYQRGSDIIENTRPEEQGYYFHWIAGLLAAGRGDLEKAHRHAEEIRRTFNNTTENLAVPEALAEKRFYFNLLGEIALAGGQSGQAVRMHEIALEHSSRADEAFFRCYLGKACLEAHRAPQAKEHFKRVLAINPRLPDALLSLGRLYLAEDEPDQAGPILDRLDQLWKGADKEFKGRLELDRLLMRL